MKTRELADVVRAALPADALATIARDDDGAVVVAVHERTLSGALASRFAAAGEGVAVIYAPLVGDSCESASVRWTCKACPHVWTDEGPASAVLGAKLPGVHLAGWTKKTGAVACGEADGVVVSVRVRGLNPQHTPTGPAPRSAPEIGQR